MDPPGSVMWINKIKSENLSIFILFRAQKKYFWSTLAPTCNSAQLELGAKVASKTYLLLLFLEVIASLELTFSLSDSVTQ